MYNKKNLLKSICLILVVLMITAVAMVACSDKDAQASADKANEAVATLEGKVTELKTALEQAKSDITAVTNKADNLANTLGTTEQTLNNKVEAAKTTLQGDINAVKTIAEQNKTKIANLEAELNKVKNDPSNISALQNEVTTLKNEVSGLKTNLGKLETRVKTLEDAVKANSDDIDELEGKVTDTEDAINHIVTALESYTYGWLKNDYEFIDQIRAKLNDFYGKITKNTTLKNGVLTTSWSFDQRADNYSTHARQAVAEEVKAAIAEVAYTHMFDEGDDDHAKAKEYILGKIDAYLNDSTKNMQAYAELEYYVGLIEKDGKIDSSDKQYFDIVESIVKDFKEGKVSASEIRKNTSKSLDVFKPTYDKASTTVYYGKSSSKENVTLVARAEEDLKKIDNSIKYTKVATAAQPIADINAKVIVTEDKEYTRAGDGFYVYDEKDYVKILDGYFDSLVKLGIVAQGEVTIDEADDNKFNEYAKEADKLLGTKFENANIVFRKSIDRFKEIADARTDANSTTGVNTAIKGLADGSYAKKHYGKDAVASGYVYKYDKGFYDEIIAIFGFDENGDISATSMLGKWINKYHIVTDHSKPRDKADAKTGYAQENYEDIITNLKTLDQLIETMKADPQKKAEYDMVQAFLAIENPLQTTNACKTHIDEAIKKMEALFDVLHLEGTDRTAEKIAFADGTHYVIIKTEAGKYVLYDVKATALMIKETRNAYIALMDDLKSFQNAFKELTVNGHKMALTDTFAEKLTDTDFNIVFNGTSTVVTGTIKNEKTFVDLMNKLNAYNADILGKNTYDYNGYAEVQLYKELKRVIAINDHIDDILVDVNKNRAIIDNDTTHQNDFAVIMNTFYKDYASKLLKGKDEDNKAFDLDYFNGLEKRALKVDNSYGLDRVTVSRYAVSDKAGETTWTSAWSAYISKYVEEFYKPGDYKK